MGINNVLVFDIETVPDVASGRALQALDGLDDGEVAQVMIQQRLNQTQGGSDFIRPHLHRVVAISAVFRHDGSEEGIKISSFGTPEDGEATLVRAFFRMVDRHQPCLVSWNGCAFDLPVLHYRALLHGIAARHYWDQGEILRESRYNNYLNRYHNRHLDLMDILSAYQARAVAPLQDIAVMLGLPGKLGMTGGQVWEQYQAGNLDGIRSYCEIDVLNTYLVYLRWELNRGHLDDASYAAEIGRVRAYLQRHAAAMPHFEEFLSLWAA